ncbi:hypothetical protein O181_124363 [Austropuccinia psidii MF-1]|uniref:Uncharacterized protein n=1 Tax=Austropuccinia psidii MF-1 TaxID=1389203 RepID=A0A9Q3KNK1_9BASI|nr:hypothetical protein [Austropuccinia psidii MF-1]
MPTEVEINIPVNESSDEEFHLKTKMIQLNPHNRVQWSCQMENYLTSRRFDNLLQPPSEATKVTPKSKQKNSSALLLLWGYTTDQALFTNTKLQHKSRQEEKKFKGKGHKFGKKTENPNQQSTAKTEASKFLENLEKMIANQKQI